MNPWFNETTVLEYIKKVFGVPYNILEFEDDYIVEKVIKDQTNLKEFSRYFPKEERIVLDTHNNERTVLSNLYNSNPKRYKDLKIPKQDSNIWVLESDNEILGIKRIINNPINDSLAYYADSYAISNPVESATFDLTRSFMNKPITHKFLHPNRVEIKGYCRPGRMMAILETVHDNDLSTIPSSLHLEYNKLCTYRTAELLLHIRNKYTNMSTPFGELNVNTDWIQQIADKKTELLQSFASPSNFTSRGLGIIVV